jgi:hypothetical protein
VDLINLGKKYYLVCDSSSVHIDFYNWLGQFLPFKIFILCIKCCGSIQTKIFFIAIKIDMKFEIQKDFLNQNISYFLRLFLIFVGLKNFQPRGLKSHAQRHTFATKTIFISLNRKINQGVYKTPQIFCFGFHVNCPGYVIICAIDLRSFLKGLNLFKDVVIYLNRAPCMWDKFKANRYHFHLFNKYHTNYVKPISSLRLALHDL